MQIEVNWVMFRQEILVSKGLQLGNKDNAIYSNIMDNEPTINHADKTICTLFRYR